MGPDKGAAAAAAVSPALVERVRGVIGQQGEEWLAGLPQLAKELAARWRLAVQPPFSGLSYN